MSQWEEKAKLAKSLAEKFSCVDLNTQRELLNARIHIIRYKMDNEEFTNFDEKVKTNADDFGDLVITEKELDIINEAMTQKGCAAGRQRKDGKSHNQVKEVEGVKSE